MTKLKSIFCLIFVLFFLGACGVPDRTTHLPSAIAERVKAILVLPFDVHCPTESPLPFYCPVTGIVPGEIEPQAKEILSSLLRKELEPLTTRYSFLVLSQNDYETLLEEALSQSKDHSSLIRFFAEKTGTQAILYGKVFRFKERKGSSWSVVEPASVAFTLILYDGQSGRILWQRTFDETQKPLSEDLLRLPLYGKIKWLSAEELAQRGMMNLLKSFP